VRGEERIARGLGQPALFAIAAGAIASSLYYILGVVAGQAQGLTPLVFAVGALFFVLTMLTYVEGNSLHPERGGAAVLSRYAFNELWSFLAGWAILLDFLIVLALGAVAVPHYLGAFWAEAADGAIAVLISAATIGWVAWMNFQGVSAQRYKQVLRLSLLSLAVFAGIVVVGAIQLFDLSLITDSIDIGTLPALDDLVFAMVIATVACTGIGRGCPPRGRRRGSAPASAGRPRRAGVSTAAPAGRQPAPAGSDPPRGKRARPAARWRPSRGRTCAGPDPAVATRSGPRPACPSRRSSPGCRDPGSGRR